MQGQMAQGAPENDSPAVEAEHTFRGTAASRSATSRDLPIPSSPRNVISPPLPAVRVTTDCNKIDSSRSRPGYYYGDCDWLYERAIATGSRCSWTRHRLCRDCS